MTFFYDLNKRLAAVNDKPETTQLNERDMGKHNNATTGFKALAKKAGGGEKGERIAGAQFQKMKKAGQLEGIFQGGPDKSQIPTYQRKNDPLTLKDLEKERTQSPTSADGMRALQDKLKHIHPMDQVKEGAPVNFDKVLDAIAALYGDDIWDNDAMQDLANDLEQAGPTDQELDFIIAKGKLPKRLANIQFSAGDSVQFGEGSSPMTSKQKSFAALAEPKDKITFADKIAGAKKEVDEMLGDVAAEAMKAALSGGQKKLDKNKNGKLDAMDFEMLRKGGKKQETSEDDNNNPFTNYKNPRAEQPRVGSVTHGAKHDTEWTSTGRKVTRRVDPQGNSVGSETDAEGNTIEKRGRGRPAGPAKAPERTTAKAYKHKGDRKVKEGDIDEGADYGQAQQIYNDLADIRAIAKQAQGGRQFPAGFASRLESALWAAMTLLKNQQSGSAQVSEKAPPGEKAERMVKGIKKSLSKDGNLSDKDKSIAYATAWKAKKAGKVEEESTDKEDQTAEKAGKKVAKDIEYDEGHKGKDDNKAEKAGKKVTKDIEYDDKKDKKKKEEVEETTTSGSVATSAEAPKKGKGGISFGQGIYDSMNREVEAMISESMSVNISSSTEGGKSITVTATEEDADKLAELLKMAGLGQQSESCPQCGSASCGCDEMTEAYGDTDETKNYPNWPTNKEGSDNPFQYSGGLNRPKSTGQTTIPVVASQLDRQRTLESSLEQEFKNFKI